MSTIFTILKFGYVLHSIRNVCMYPRRSPSNIIGYGLELYLLLAPPEKRDAEAHLT